MHSYTYIQTPDAITVFFGCNAPQVIPRSAPHATCVVRAIASGATAAELKKLCNPATAVTSYSNGCVVVKDGAVEVSGRRVHACLERKLVALMRDGQPFEYFANYLRRIYSNTSSRAIEESFNFLDREGLPITDEGMVLAYKGVQTNRYSVRGNTATKLLTGCADAEGRIYNGNGCVIAVDRRDVDDDCNRTCSHGLHVGSYAYASNWGPVVVLVEVDPADIVSIPTDCDGQKMRVCKYRVIGDAHGLMPESVVSANRPYDTLHQEPEDDEFDLEFTQDEVDSLCSEAYDDGYANGAAATTDAVIAALNR